MQLQLLRYLIIIVGVVLLPNKLLAQKEFYTPKSLLIPLHDQKNQLHFSFGRGGGYDFNLSYAFTDKLALFSAATFDNDTKKRLSIIGDRYDVDRDDYALKGGFGYFTKTDNPEFPIIEAYVGTGITKINNYWHFKGDTDGEATQARYWSVFGQFNAGKRVSESEYGLGLRFTYSQYTDFSFYDTYSSSTKSSYKSLRGLTADPEISAGYNLYGVIIQAQVGVAIPLLAPLVERTDTHTTYEGTTEIRTSINSDEKMRLYSLIGRLSLQYKVNFNKK
ncbi:hypothetical protein [Pontibacter anaerobius]|uniref:Outer membrane protein beta-barrel domain-containing protein n=1 Tax=Pontibacter anaerobius TaxID=2993940 RepID=A0ABT3RIB4_9BACT|nr:hypothetical protein [Pontibacter anaerobius]MCX2741285.1 hypothetical protein [Pontibacter anaerobius]